MEVYLIIVETNYDPPPIPIREYDWAAAFDWEPGNPVGYGKTKQDALNDLVQQVWEQEDEDAD